jgi:DNA polymerase I-like protein with 3'-5' exonuclease and polymerase domains|tara:strand:- start:2490 stop:4241 length:1752 start_codon:yes stop_codon:yes gene_type:complete
MKLLFDIETDGLEYTKIWCLVAQEVDTGEVWSYGPDEIEEGVQLLNGAEQLSGHNIIGFDIPALEELTSFKLGSQRIIDTLVLSRLFNPVREGGHSLAVWGGKLGLSKIEFKEFESYSPQMLEYCKRDVAVNVKVYKSLQREGVGFDPRSIVLETETARILKDQEKNGFYFDEYAADMLLALMRTKMKDAEDEVTKVFKPKMDKRLIYRKNTANGSVSKMGCWDTPSGSGVRLTTEEHEILSQPATFSTTRVTIVDFSISSRKQIGEYLIEFGWKPEEFTVNGRPVVNEKTLSQIKDIPQAELIKDYLMYQKREAQIKSWIKALKEDGRVHGYVNSNGTITGRMTHNNPNMAQVPSSGSPYGKECRACWTVPKGYKLVGIDASGLELRMLAHYMDDQEYTNEILNGDIHTTNQKLAGLESRNQAKTFIYALLYGAGDEKLGSVAGGGKSVGSRLRQSFFDNLPAFSTLKDRVARASGKGFLKGLDGRKVFVRSEHSALNTLLQGAGAIVMKQALVMFDDKLIGLDAKFVCNVHDEWQLEVAEDQADVVGKHGVDAIIEAGKVLDLKCPLDGEYNVGINWSETH